MLAGTAEVEAYTAIGPNEELVHLIDTPGFDDTQTSNVDLLRKIASFLGAMDGHRGIPLAGLIYMHRITDKRVAGSSLESIRIFEKITGEENFPSVTLITTMWNLLDGEVNFAIGLGREKILLDKQEFFGRMFKGGAQVVRDSGDHASADAIIARIVKQRSLVVTALQKEMSVRNMTLDLTTVGSFLLENIEKAQLSYERERRELEEALEDARQDEDDEMALVILEQQKKVEQRLQTGRMQKQTLASSGDDLARYRAEWTEELFAHHAMREAEVQAEVQAARQRISQLEETLRLKDEDHRLQLHYAETHKQRLEYGMHISESEKQQLQQQLEQLRKQSEAHSKNMKLAKGKEKLAKMMRFMTGCSEFPESLPTQGYAGTSTEGPILSPQSTGRRSPLKLAQYSSPVRTHTVPNYHYGAQQVRKTSVSHVQYTAAVASPQVAGLVDHGIGAAVQVSSLKRSYTQPT